MDDRGKMEWQAIKDPAEAHNEALEAEWRQALADEAAKDEKLESHRLASIEENRRIYGPWIAGTPYPIEQPSLIEALAWNAPGLIGRMVREGAAKRAERGTLIPQLGAALVSFSVMVQGKFVSYWDGHYTPPCAMLVLVGGTGSGKSTAIKLFADYKTYLANNTAAVFISRPKSGPGLLQYASRSPIAAVNIINEEASGILGATGEHSDSSRRMMALIYTAYETGIDPEPSADDKRTTEPLPCPQLSALLCIQNELLQKYDKKFAALGELGRMLFIQIPDLDLIEYEKRPQFSDALIKEINQFIKLAPPMVPTGGLSSNPLKCEIKQTPLLAHFSYVIQYSAEADEYLKSLRLEYDTISRDEKRDLLVRYVAKRMVEAINRIATICGIAAGEWETGISIQTVRWSAAFVKESLQFVIDMAADTGVVDSGAPAPQRIRGAIKAAFSRSLDEWGADARQGINDRLEVKRGALNRLVKDKTGLGAQVKAEIQDMIDDKTLGAIKEQTRGERDRRGPKPEWVFVLRRF
ncbi:hypothetical protein RGQ15_09590 [Paracoccus sp. MBLB3053]|uniref:AAA+ ATPase domain-containing protein n=1 Tax=Paracoccus aurantius TaxID=3073814 RepID=A0ABU2HRX9_9RHOB|nr:hypothetical protein [Paracoccus sp. MBLB3053]MDS9467819.1 hypothetical protein [Paracoccus sp. MBLB3053]